MTSNKKEQRTENNATPKEKKIANNTLQIRSDFDKLLDKKYLAKMFLILKS